MRTSGRFPTHHIPDDGTRYAPVDTVQIDHSSGQVRIKGCARDLRGGELPSGHGVRRPAAAAPSRPPQARGPADQQFRSLDTGSTTLLVRPLTWESTPAWPAAPPEPRRHTSRHPAVDA
jgi:hypothetical protein